MRAAGRLRSSGRGCVRVRGVVLIFLLGMVSFLSGVVRDGAAVDLDDDVFWESVSCGSAEEVDLYLEKFPAGRHVEAARECLTKIRKPDIVKILGRDLIAEAMDRETGWTDLHFAAVADLSKVVVALIRDGVPVDQRLRGEGVHFSVWLHNVLSGLDHGEAFGGWTADNETALMIAVYVDALRAAAALVNLGADIHAKNNNGLTPLHFAAQGNAVNAARFLVDRGANIHEKNNYGETPLNSAAWGNAVDVARFLVDRGADIHVKSNDGETPLHSAAWGNAVDAARFLVDRRADIHAKSNAGLTPLHLAAQFNSIDAARFLVDRRADIHAKGNDGLTPLHLAAFWNAVDAARILVDRGADIHARGNDGRTPLHLAALGKAVDAARFLVDRGADIHAKDNYGWTPLDISQYTEIQDILRSQDR